MEINNRELKIEMLDNFVFATMATLEEFTEFIDFLPPYVRELKAEVILDLRLELENEAKITEIDSKIKVLKALYHINNEVLMRNIPDKYGKKGAEGKMKLNTDLVMLKELIEELEDETNR